MNNSDRDEQSIHRLIRSSGRGPTPSDDARARIRAAVHEEWQLHNPPAGKPERIHFGGDGSWMSRGFAFAMAATVALALALGVILREPANVAAVQVAAVTKVVGTVSSIDPGEARAALTADVAVYTGSRLETGVGGSAVLDINGGISLLVGAQTALRFADPVTIEVLRGRVYLDTGGVSVDPGSVLVRTPYGDVEHVGTQYEVRLDATELRVRVREGEVSVNTSRAELRSVAGEELLVAQGGTVERGAISPSDPYWEWTQSLVALPEANEYALSDVLLWAARQTGRELRYEDASKQAQSQQLILHNIGGLNPRETMEVIESTTGLRLRLSDEDLIVY